MIIKKVIVINKWTEWPVIVNNSIIEFKEIFSVLPNILTANEHTYSQFDYVTHINPSEKNNIRTDGKPSNESEKSNLVELSGYINMLTELDFAVDDKMKDKEIKLIYDDNADWENEPEPEPITHNALLVKY